MNDMMPVSEREARKAAKRVEKAGRMAPVEARTERQVKKAEKNATKEAQRVQNLSDYGAEVERGNFGARRITIYANGYVRVTQQNFKRPEYERLISIEASADVTKKTGLGRGLAATWTLGANLLSSNKRGDVYLTIVTDQQTYTLHEQPPTEWGLKTSKRLEGAGNGVLATNSAESPADAPSSSADELAKLAELHSSGVLSDDEFAAMKAKILAG